MFTHSTTKKYLILIALCCFVFQLGATLFFSYGIFRDELYYIACTEHISWGYVDQPPFSIFLLKVFRFTFGDALWAIRLFAALAHATLVYLAGIVAIELGARKYAVCMAAVSVFLIPIYVAMFSFYSMNAVDILLWLVVFYSMVRIIKTDGQRYWIVLGIVLGIGLLNKISFMFLGAGLAVGIAFTNPQWLKTRAPYLAAGIALLIFSPYIIWNIQHDWAHLEFIENASSSKYGGRMRWDFVKGFVMDQNPVAFGLWFGGLVMLLGYKPLRPYRMFAFTFITVLIILFLNKTSKSEYLAAAFSILYISFFAGVDQWKKSSLRTTILYIYPVLVFATTLFLMPIIRPILPVEKYIAFAEATGFKPSSSENKEVSALPQFYADMFGWEEKAAAVARVYETLTEDEKSKVAIYAENYGRNAAIDFFGAKYGLPKSIGSHNNYWIWGPRDYSGEIMIILGGKNHEKQFESCEVVATAVCDYCMPYENNVPIYLCRGLKWSLQENWSAVKHYD